MPPFRPLFRTTRTSRDSSKGSSGRRLTHTRMWLQGIRLGYSRRDLMEMTVGELLWDFEAMSSDEQDAGGDVREATQEDIRRMLA